MPVFMVIDTHCWLKHKILEKILYWIEWRSRERIYKGGKKGGGWGGGGGEGGGGEEEEEEEEEESGGERV